MDKKGIFKVLVVDNKSAGCCQLNAFLQELENVSVVGMAKNVEQAIYQVVEFYPNLILLDVDIPGTNGIELIRLIRKRNVDVPIAVVSAHKKFAIEAIRNGIYDFLLKPVCSFQLKKMIDKFRTQNNKDLPCRLTEVLNNIKEETKIKINSRYSYILVNPDDIVYCEAQYGATLIHLRNGKTETANATLCEIESKIASFDFFRLGRSVLINIKFIRQVGKINNTCTLCNNGYKWHVKAPQKSIKELLFNRFDYA